VNNDVVLVSAGSAAASGSGLVKQEGDEAPLTTLKGKTFVCPLYTKTQHFETDTFLGMKNDIFMFTDGYYITGTSDSEATIYCMGRINIHWDGTPNPSENFGKQNITYSINGSTITFNNDGIQSTATITGSRSFTLAGTTVKETDYDASTANILGPASRSSSGYADKIINITTDQVFIQGNVPSTGSCVRTTEYYNGDVYYCKDGSMHHPDGSIDRDNDDGSVDRYYPDGTVERISDAYN
ncbi:MAG: hypothetical protein ILP18_02795, partial [Treponema sp.]|nr:hypothetical protein [Treponema sp.]